MLPYDPHAVAEAILATLESAASQRGRATLAIPGGRSPAGVLRELAAMCDSFLRSRLHLLWVDERGVPRSDPQRNDLATIAAWQAGGPLPAAVLPMPAEDEDLEAAASRYATTLLSATQGSGILDLCLLGIGEDGHIASLFPDHPGLRELGEVFAIRNSPKPPPRRLSLTLPVLVRAEALVILALGEAKGAIAQAVRRGPSPHIPVSLLPQAKCHWYLDDAAVRGAGGLDEGVSER
jgi:6-phosphogluconolactonase